MPPVLSPAAPMLCRVETTLPAATPPPDLIAAALIIAAAALPPLMPEPVNPKRLTTLRTTEGPVAAPKAAADPNSALVDPEDPLFGFSGSALPS
eukprot:CAMPEP_0184326282 /NCGR_PEP_ID=MMETSP1049-20130417/142481_1 /TAXON_ID=77928 /ORGANISM="Proteomonas sulcata, Strain CCMP704" /LENGTH=93 /DNA_ID=CAMNT_0026648467 /DNA_START=1083 /DNA_END=1364 /DNA_ORIENTATION=+